MANVVLLPSATAQRVSHGELLGAALANGLDNVSKTLFAYSIKKQQQEEEDKRLAQNLAVAQSRAQMSQQRLQDTKDYRSKLLAAKQKDQIDLGTYRDASLALGRDRVDALTAHQDVTEELSQARLAVEQARAARAAANGGKPPKPNNLQMIVEDQDRVNKGLAPKYFPGASADTLNKLLVKAQTPTIMQVISADTPVGNPSNPAGSPQPPAPQQGGNYNLSTPAGMPGGSPSPGPDQSANPYGVTLPGGWQMHVTP